MHCVVFSSLDVRRVPRQPNSVYLHVTPVNKSICSERLFCTLAVDDLAQVCKQPLTLLTNQHPSLRLSCGEGKCFTWELAWGLATRFFHLNIPTGCCHPPYSPEGKQEQAYILKGGFSHLLVIFVHIWDIFFNWNHSC